MLPDLTGLPHDALAAHLDRIGAGAHHAGRVFSALHKGRVPLESLPDLGPRLAARIASASRLVDVRVASDHRCDDGSTKLLFALEDAARVEGVLLPGGRRTAFCVSSQVGCAMGCAFCATARLGLARGLEAGEIVRQVELAAERDPRLGCVVFMGMGEPLHYYDATRDAIRVITDTRGLNLAPSRVTVSTSGLVPGIRRLAEDFGGSICLALSLAAGTDETRARLIPSTKRWGLADLRAACGEWPLRGSRWLMLELVVLPAVNDGVADLDGIVAFTRGLRAVVNLISFNPFPGAPFTSPTAADIDRVWRYLVARGVAVTVRRPRGRSVSAACGQLALSA